MGSETVIQRICFRNSCGIFLRDFMTIKFEGYCYFLCSAIFLIFAVNKYCNFKACC